MGLFAVKLSLLHESLTTGSVDIGPGGSFGKPQKKRWKSKRLEDDGYLSVLTPEKDRPRNKVDENKKSDLKRKQVNTMDQVWQTVDAKNSRKKTQKGFNDRSVYAATTSMDHPYGEMGL